LSPLRRKRTAGPRVVTDDIWTLVAEREEGAAGKEPGEYSGKWLCFIALEDAEEMWRLVEAATRAGRLGSYSALRSPREGFSGQVIEVHTTDWRDESEVRRVREELRKLGFRSAIPYKADSDSRSGVYGETGFRKISRYYE
jgi:hypothetical protein